MAAFGRRLLAILIEGRTLALQRSVESEEIPASKRDLTALSFNYAHLRGRMSTSCRCGKRPLWRTDAARGWPSRRLRRSCLQRADVGRWGIANEERPPTIGRAPDCGSDRDRRGDNAHPGRAGMTSRVCRRVAWVVIGLFVVGAAGHGARAQAPLAAKRPAEFERRGREERDDPDARRRPARGRHLSAGPRRQAGRRAVPRRS